jgi:hypothetical protein
MMDECHFSTIKNLYSRCRCAGENQRSEVKGPEVVIETPEHENDTILDAEPVLMWK